MAEAILMKDGGGLDSDDVTATASDVLQGKTALTNDSHDEPVQGTMLDRRHTPGSLGKINSSYPYVMVWDGISPQLKEGGDYICVTPPTGFYTTHEVFVGIHKDVVKACFGIGSVINFNCAQYGHKQVRLSWARPTGGMWSGVRIVAKKDSVPQHVNDGTWSYETADIYCITPVLDEGRWFFRAWNYVTVNAQAGGRWYGSDVTREFWNSGVNGHVTLNAGAGVWTVPEGVRRIRFIVVGHGGNALPARTDIHDKSPHNGMFQAYDVSPGAGGGYFVSGYANVSPGEQINWVVPTSTTATIFGGSVANPGESGHVINQISDLAMQGGNGGSGGGTMAGAGGSNGGDGQDRYDPALVAAEHLPGIGQHSSTMGFNGVLYCGGGAGGDPWARHPGGAGGGGAAGDTNNNQRWFGVGDNGVNGLGGGAGGSTLVSQAAVGGTGCIYIAWGHDMNDGT